MHSVNIFYTKALFRLYSECQKSVAKMNKD